jgi:hypothetical protein
MNMISSSDFIFRLPPLGKPNPNESSANPSRSRVVQLPQKPGDTCYYYAMNIIRERIGKNPSEEQKDARQKEALLSSLRKQLTQNQLELKKVQNSLDQLLSSSKGITVRFMKGNSIVGPEEIIKEKAAQTGNTNEVKIKIEFFKSIHADYLEFYNKKLKPFIEKKWEQLNTKERSKMLNIFLYNKSIEYYNLKGSTWIPRDPIQVLTQEIDAHGPLMVAGLFGKEFYADPPFALTEKVASKTIYGWSPQAARIPQPRVHVVVLVGARKNPDLVYFVDPRDGSDPQNPDSQIVYAMSYRRVQESICNHLMLQMKSKDKPHFSKDYTYGFYGPQG